MLKIVSLFARNDSRSLYHGYSINANVEISFSRQSNTNLLERSQRLSDFTKYFRRQSVAVRFFLFELESSISSASSDLLTYQLTTCEISGVHSWLRWYVIAGWYRLDYGTCNVFFGYFSESWRRSRKYNNAHCGIRCALRVTATIQINSNIFIFCLIPFWLFYAFSPTAIASPANTNWVFV